MNKRFLKPHTLALTLVAVLIAGLGVLFGPLLVSGPQIIGMTPADGVTNANPQEGVRIEFNQWVRPETVAAAIAFDPPAEFTVEQVSGALPWRSAVIVKPTGGLTYDTRYRLTVGPVANLLGRPLAQPQTIAFETVPYFNVVGFRPGDGSAKVKLNAPITVIFDQPVVSAEAIAAAADDPALASALPGAETTPIVVLTPETQGIGRWLSPTMYGFYPAEGLHAATEYSASIRTDLTLDGAARLAQPVAWRFSTESPLLVSARPFNDAVEVPADGAIDVWLARDVDIGSASKHFSLAEVEGGATVEGKVIPTETGFRFQPASALQRSARYEASIAPGVTSRTGATLNEQPVTWRFAVMGDLDVMQVEPLADASDVLTTTHRISVKFNHPVVALTTLDTARTTHPAPLQINPALPGVGRWLDTSTYVYSPTVALPPATDFTVDVAAGLQDQTGGALKNPYSWTFSTLKPRVDTSVPASGDRFVGPNDPIRILFNQAMRADSVRSALQLVRDDTGAVVDGSVDVVGHIATFTPATPLERGAEYRLIVPTSARNAQGNAGLAVDYDALFRVAPLPQLASSEPVDGNTSVEPFNSVTLNFNTPMDWASVEQNLTIDPAPKKTDVFTSAYDTTFSLYLPLQPETDYRISVGGAAQDPYGVALGQDAVVNFRTGPLPPSLSLIGTNRIGTYNAYVSVRAPVRAVNVDSVRYTLHTLAPNDAARLAGDYDSWNVFVPDGAALREGDLAVGGERNKERVTLLELGDLEPGLYFLDIKGPGILRDRQILAVSPYALTIKRSADRLFVWAIDLANGKPVGDIALTGAAFSYAGNSETARPTLSEPTELGKTDDDGILQAPFKSTSPFDPVFLWSTSGTFVFGTTNWGEGINPWDFGLPADYAQNPVVGNIATERPIYRPEQNVYIRGVARINRDQRYELPGADQQIVLDIRDPEGNSVISQTLSLSEFGAFHTSLPLEQGAKLGTYSMAARFAGDKEERSFYGTFVVAEYRKPAFEVAVTPGQTDVIQGDKLVMNVTANYFSGGMVANAPVKWRLLSNPYYFAPESAPNYRFEDLDDAYEWYRWFDNTRAAGGDLVSEGDATTDAQGRFTITLPSDLQGSGSDPIRSRTFTFDVEITDVDGQVIASQGEAIVHAGAFYIGLRPEGYVAEAGKPQPVSLITLDSQGKPVANRALDVGIYKREWYTTSEQGPDGRFYTTSAYSDTLVETKSATTDALGRASVEFTPPEGGSYRIGAESKDDAGHTIRASAFTWAYGGEVFWGVNDTNRVDLIADKDRYKPGETANILVTAPYKGMNALMTIERGQVIEHKLLTLQDTTEVLQVPISAEHAPNVYVSIVLVKVGDDLPAPDLRVGLVNLPVSTEQQELNITVTPDKQQAGPREDVTYSIKAADYTGKGVKAEVSLALVDKAVLSLADDPNKTLTEAFYEKRPLGVFTANTLTALVDRMTLKLQPGGKGGGGGDAAKVLVRRDFPDTAYWNPTLVTGDDGTASVTVTLPDSLTTWRMTARGVTQNTLVGQSTQELIATRPLLARPTLPRFLTVGDQPTLQAVVQNTTDKPIDAAITLSAAAGSEGAGATPIQINADTQQTVQVPANGTAVVRWPVVVGAKAGERIAEQVKLNFAVSGGGYDDAAEYVLPIQRFMTPETVATAGQAQGTVVETIELPASSDGSVPEGQFDLELAPSLAAGVQNELTYLQTYPYACAEQTASNLLANAVIHRLVKQLGRDDADLKSRLERSLAQGLQRLNQIQNLDGGWGWWSSDASNPYVTAYAVQALIETRKAGFGVDQQALDNGLRYLESALDDDELSAKRDGWRRDARAFALFVLAEAGKPDRGRTIALFEERSQLDIYGRAYLLMTLKSIGGEDERVRTLVSDLMGTALLHTTSAHWEEQEIDWWTMSSNTRTTALAMQALGRADPGNYLIPNAVRYLMAGNPTNGGDMQRVYRRTTQESATTLIALSEYIAQSGELEGDYSYSAALDGKSIGEGKINRDNLDTPINIVFSMADVKLGGASELELERQAGAGQSGKGRLYYSVRMRYYQDAKSIQPLDQGITVAREYIAVDTDTLTPTGELVTQAKLGDVVQVRLTINAPEDIYHLAVEDMLPAGLEPLDTSLKTVSAAAQDPTLEEAGNERPYWWYWSQTEIHDNRVALFATDLRQGTYTYTYLARASTPGTFETLPTTAYQMYEPEVFGRSAGAVFTVTP
jgi:hypothetical protein